MGNTCSGSTNRTSEADILYFGFLTFMCQRLLGDKEEYLLRIMLLIACQKGIIDCFTAYVIQLRVFTGAEYFNTWITIHISIQAEISHILIQIWKPMATRCYLFWYSLNRDRKHLSLLIMKSRVMKNNFKRFPEK